MLGPMLAEAHYTWLTLHEVDRDKLEKHWYNRKKHTADFASPVDPCNT